MLFVVPLSELGAQPYLLLHHTPPDYSGWCNAIDPSALSCSDLVTEVDGYDPYEAQFVWVLATSPPAGLNAVRFGVEYDDETVQNVSWIPCVSGTEIPGQDWPDSGTNNAVAFDACETGDGPDDLVVIGFFVFDVLQDPVTFSVTPITQAGNAPYVSCDGFTYGFDPLDLASVTINSSEPGYNPCIPCEPASRLSRPTSTSLVDPSLAEYVVVCPDSFATVAEELALWRADHHDPPLDAAVVPLGDMATGQPSAQDIKDYINDLFQTSPRPPAYVVLLGDGKSSEPDRDLIPTHKEWYTGYNPSNTGEYPVEGFYALLDEDDEYDVILARIPAGTVAEAQDYVNKVIRYDICGATDGWTGNALHLVGDANINGAFGFLDDWNDDIVDALPASLNHTTIKASDYFPDTEDGGDDIVDAINAGHGFVNVFGQTFSEEHVAVQMYDKRDHSALEMTNAERLPFLSFSSCRQTDFSDPASCVAEHFVMAPGRGAVAAVGPAAWASFQASLDFPRQAYQEIGRAVTTSLGAWFFAYRNIFSRSMWFNPEDEGYNETQVFMGDPGISLHLDLEALPSDPWTHGFEVGEPLAHQWEPISTTGPSPQGAARRAGAWSSASGSTPSSGSWFYEAHARFDPTASSTAFRYRLLTLDHEIEPGDVFSAWLLLHATNSPDNAWHIDFLFQDGTRLSDLSVASDVTDQYGNAWTDAVPGTETIGLWRQLRWPMNDLVGRTITEVHVVFEGAPSPVDDITADLSIDDLAIYDTDVQFVYNGSFEQDVNDDDAPDGWSVSVGDTLHRVSSTFVDGDHVLWVSDTGGNGAVTLSEFIDAPEGSGQYVLSFSVLAQAGDEVTVEVRDGASSTLIHSEDFTQSDAAFEYKETAFVLPTAYESLELRASAPLSMYVDDVRLTRDIIVAAPDAAPRPEPVRLLSPTGRLPLRLSLPPAPTAVRVFDVTGALVYEETLTHDALEWTWDGVMSTGVAIAPGVYFFSVVAEASTRHLKAVVF